MPTTSHSTSSQPCSISIGHSTSIGSRWTSQIIDMSIRNHMKFRVAVEMVSILSVAQTYNHTHNHFMWLDIEVPSQAHFIFEFSFQTNIFLQCIRATSTRVKSCTTPNGTPRIMSIYLRPTRMCPGWIPLCTRARPYSVFNTECTLFVICCERIVCA